MFEFVFIFFTQAQKIDTLLWQYTWKPIDHYVLAHQSGKKLDTLVQFSVFYPIKQGFSAILEEPAKIVLKQKIFQITKTSETAKADTQTIFATSTPSHIFLVAEKDTFWLQEHQVKYKQAIVLSANDSGFVNEKGEKTITFKPFIQKNAYWQYLTTTMPTNKQNLKKIAYFILLSKLKKSYDRLTHNK